jgi:hypothetical protein
MSDCERARKSRSLIFSVALSAIAAAYAGKGAFQEWQSSFRRYENVESSNRRVPMSGDFGAERLIFEHHFPQA